MKPDPIEGKLITEERIRERAHQLWIAEGRPEGRERDHWEKARMLLEHETPEVPPAEPSPTFTDTLTSTVDPLQKTKTAAKKKRSFKSTKA